MAAPYEAAVIPYTVVLSWSSTVMPYTGLTVYENMAPDPLQAADMAENRLRRDWRPRTVEDAAVFFGHVENLLPAALQEWEDRLVLNPESEVIA